MKKILIILIMLVLSSLIFFLAFAQEQNSPRSFSEKQREQEIMNKCTGLGHWSMIKCAELESQGKDGRSSPVRLREKYQSLADLSKQSNPIPSNKESIEQGKTVYYQYCFACHDMEGKGRGPGAEYTGRVVPDLTSLNVRKESDGVLFWKITEGNIPRPMPLFRAFLTKEDIWNIVNYLRTLSPDLDKKE